MVWTPTARRGFHAVVIVGWGMERGVKNWMGHGPATLDIPYWIVRNSWSTAWNAGNRVNDNRLHLPGYWKHAMNVSVNGQMLNRGVGMDHFVRASGGLIGGCTTLYPAVRRVTPSHHGMRTSVMSDVSSDTKEYVVTSEGGGGNNLGTLVGVIGLILLVLLVVILCLRRPRAPMSSLGASQSVGR